MRPPALSELAVPDAVEGVVEDVVEVLDEAWSRGTAAWDVLRGERVGPPAAVRRWPWAVGAAVAGAAAGVAVAFVGQRAVQRLHTQDPPGAVDPETVEAVIDRPT